MYVIKLRVRLLESLVSTLRYLNKSDEEQILRLTGKSKMEAIEAAIQRLEAAVTEAKSDSGL